MSRLLRRLYSTASSPSAAETASRFLQKHSSAPPRTVSQYLDANQYSRFAATVPVPTTSSSSTASPDLAASTRDGSPTGDGTEVTVPLGTPMPPGYHLAFFTPSQPTSELGADGSDTSYNPSAPFTRRMWAGGELVWSQKHVLKVGDEVSEKTTVQSAAAKKTKAGEEMVVVGVEKEFSTTAGVALVDRRNWIFRPAITTPLPISSAPARKAFPDAKYFRDYDQSATTLFRFSALTFNGHKIHYSVPWCREVEGHRGIVVHGPLNLLLMLELWRDVAAQRNGAKSSLILNPKSVVYRATHPLYAGEPYRICMDEEVDGVSELRIVDSFGNTNMVGKITRF